jgi:hypothetical protein
MEFQIMNIERSQHSQWLLSVLQDNLMNLQATPKQRITTLRVALRKTIEFLNKPYVRCRLEQRGISVDEKLLKLRSEFLALTKYPIYTEDDAEITVEHYENSPLEFIEFARVKLSHDNFFHESPRVTTEEIDEKV